MNVFDTGIFKQVGIRHWLGWVAPIALIVSCSDSRSPAGVRPGIEVLVRDSVHLVRDRAVGLITNHTGLERDGTPSAAALIRAGANVVALFTPEHGYDGRVAGGERIGDAVDRSTGLPIISLYGDRRAPDPEALGGLDVLVFDVQDIGARYYTYVSTMKEAMRAAAAVGVRFVVADRPNPIGGLLVQGNVLDPEYASFVGPHPVPMRHGMTVGELALLFNSEERIGADLRVIPAEGWTRRAWADETGIPWVATSPNMPSLESAALYPGTCLFEGTNISVGRGTDRPFQQVGAPWLDSANLLRALEAHDLQGVRVEAVRFAPVSPDDGKYDGIELAGLRLTVEDRTVFDPARVAVAILVEMRRQAVDKWKWREASFDRLAGTDALRLGVEAGKPVQQIVGEWTEDLARFEAVRSRFLLYR